MSAPIPTRWLATMEGQLADAQRRLASADRQLEAGQGGRAIEEAYPGVMAAAIVKVWLVDEPWHHQRSEQEVSRMMRSELPSGFATLSEMRHDQRGFSGWRAEDARPLIEEARAFVAAVKALLDDRCKPSSTD